VLLHGTTLHDTFSQQVADKTLVQQLDDDIHLINVSYPTREVFLDVHQRRIVYHLAGWMLSRALSRVHR